MNDAPLCLLPPNNKAPLIRQSVRVAQKLKRAIFKNDRIAKMRSKNEIDFNIKWSDFDRQEQIQIQADRVISWFRI